MNTTLTETQQKYFLAAFSHSDSCEYESNNKIKLFQFADVHCKTASDNYPQHRQTCDEITFVYRGEGTVNHNDAAYALDSGCIHLCFEGDNHQPLSSKISPMKFYCIGYTISEDNPLFPLREEVRRLIGEGLSPVTHDSAGLDSAFRMILSQFSHDTFDSTSEHIVVSTLNYIISTVLTSYLGRPEGSLRKMSMNDNLVLYVVSFLRNNVLDPRALNRLPIDTGYSYSYLSHTFSRKMEQSLKSFFYNLRMSYARELLKTKSVTEVASTLGYSSIHSFSRAYKSFRGDAVE